MKKRKKICNIVKSGVNKAIERGDEESLYSDPTFIIRTFQGAEYCDIDRINMAFQSLHDDKETEINKRFIKCVNDEYPDLIHIIDFSDRSLSQVGITLMRWYPELDHRYYEIYDLKDGPEWKELQELEELRKLGWVKKNRERALTQYGTNWSRYMITDHGRIAFYNIIALAQRFELSNANEWIDYTLGYKYKIIKK